MKKNSAKEIIAAVCCFFAVYTVFASGKKDTIRTNKNSDTASEPVIESAPEVTPEQKRIPAGKFLRVGTLNGPTGIPVAYMYENPPVFDGTTATFESFASPAALLPKMIKGEIDIGFLPVNIAAKVYNKNNGALLTTGITDTGNVVLITKDTSVKSLFDLKGKTVSVAGQGATPDYMFRYILMKNNIGIGPGADTVNPDYSIETSKIAAELLSGKVNYAVLPEPFATVVTMRSGDVIRAIDFQKEYEKIEGENQTYPLTIMVVRAAYAKEHPKTVRDFLSEYGKSVEWTIENPNKTGVLVQKYTLGLMAPIVAKSIPSCNFTFIPADKARASIEKLLTIFKQFSPDSIGDALPDDGFYFN